MKKGIFIFIVLIIGFFVFYSGFGEDTDGLKADSSVIDENQKPIVILCPTFHYKAEEIQESDYNVILGSSSEEAVGMLSHSLIDFSIVSRPPFPGETEFNFKKYDHGYSFLSDEVVVIPEDEIENYKFFTDLEKDKLLNDFPQIKEIQKVDDVYLHINEGVVITDFKNTDYSKAQIAYLLDDFGNRLKYSKTPTLYYKEEGPEKERFLEIITEIGL